MSAKRKQDDLEATTEDAVTEVGFAALGGFGPVGAAIAAYISTQLPHRWQARATRIIRLIEAKLEDLSSDVEELKARVSAQFAHDEELGDLFQEVLAQGTRAASDERRQYLATLFANSLTREELETQQKRALLNLLGELSDADLLVLKLYSLPLDGYDGNVPPRMRDFRKSHEVLFGRADHILPRDLLVAPDLPAGRLFLANSIQRLLDRALLVREPDTLVQ
jgi:hypothetical protein